MLKTSIFILLILGCYTGNCQRLLFQKNRHRQVIYTTGDKITFRVRGDRSKITGLIRGFQNGEIVFRDYKIAPEEISHLYVDDKTRQWFILRYKYEKLFLLSGSGFLLLELINTGEIRQESLLVGGSLVTAGLLARLLITKTIKIKGRKRLIVLN